MNITLTNKEILLITDALAWKRMSMLRLSETNPSKTKDVEDLAKLHAKLEKQRRTLQDCACTKGLA